MSFAFNFEIDPDEIDDSLAPVHNKNPVQESTAIQYEPSRELSLHTLLDTLPPLISYSSIQIKDTVIPRRDLFDARFQVLAQDNEHEDKSLDFLNAPSDLVPGIYEGGLKTWECALDLVELLKSKNLSLRNKKILEIGCGTAIPSLYILQCLFNAEEDVDIEIHLLDYNAVVFELVTLPNIILTWYFSSSANEYRTTPRGTTDDDAESESQHETLHLEEPDQLILSHSLKTAFLASLSQKNITIKCFSGSWDTFALPQNSYDIVLTSETIYRTDSLSTLVNLLRSTNAALCLVAAKMLYFGVGGGVDEFVRYVTESGGMIEVVWDSSLGGVKRRILNVHW